MTAAPLVAEFGSSTWYKYLAGLCKSLLASEKSWKTELPPFQTAPINHHFSMLLDGIIYHGQEPIENIKTFCLNLHCQTFNHYGIAQSEIMPLGKEHNKNLCINRKSVSILSGAGLECTV